MSDLHFVRMLPESVVLESFPNSLRINGLSELKECSLPVGIIQVLVKLEYLKGQAQRSFSYMDLESSISSPEIVVVSWNHLSLFFVLCLVRREEEKKPSFK